MSYPASQHLVRPAHGKPSEEPPKQPSRGTPWAIVIGAALVVIGLGLVVVAVGLHDDSPLFAVGGLVLGTGVLRLTTALSKEARQRRDYLANPDDPRWHGGSGVVQLAGRTCVECEKRIVIGADAFSCRLCGTPAHLDCEGLHRARAHSHDGAPV